MQATYSPAAPRSVKPWQRWRPWFVGCALIFVVAASVVGYYLNVHWPYRYREVKPLLEQDFGSQIQMAHYHRIYFPNPGFVALGVRLHRKNAPDAPDLGYADTMVVQGRWRDLFLLRRRVQQVEVTGLHITIPPAGSRANQEDFPPGSTGDFTGPDTAIEEFWIRDAVLDVLGKKGGRLTFTIHQLVLNNMVKGKAMTYAVDMHNPLPSGHINASGNFGPLDASNIANTSVSGNFRFTSVRLADVGEIHGTLASAGQFRGPLGAMETEVDTHTPDFAVTSGRPTAVDGSMQCTVNALQGDLAIHNIDARIGATTIHAIGSIDGSPNATNLDIDVKHGRAEDILRPFIRDDVPIEGPVWLHAHAFLAPATGPGFLARLHLRGSFDAPSERAMDEQTERSLTAFSQRAQKDKGDKKSAGADPLHPSPMPAEDAGLHRDALSSLFGPARIENGVATSNHLSFKIPGAQADFQGIFNFQNKNVHLTGTLHMQSDISHTATGFKSFLLKPLAPFFKKKPDGAVIPIAVTGAPGHYQVTQNLSHDK